MKALPYILLFFICCRASAQEQDPRMLARQLTHDSRSEGERVRAIFLWIAGHIEYNTDVFHNLRRRNGFLFHPDPADTVLPGVSGAELTARRVLRTGRATCDGYAKLFQLMCTETGIECEVINGYSPCDLCSADQFRTNHSWNAVRIDGEWKLLDVTWASGYIDMSDLYVPHLDERYYLPPPAQFLSDHVPEDLRWTLLDKPVEAGRYRNAPFRYRSFMKYGIDRYQPGSGAIHATVGDTLRFSLDIRDMQRTLSISPDPFLDTATFVRTPASVFLHPVAAGGRVQYFYVVDRPGIEWVNLIYNDDLILRYHLKADAGPIKSAGFFVW